jgi:hypothetical protein
MYYVIFKVLSIWISIQTNNIVAKYHFVTHVINGGGVALEKFHTQEYCADMFTKPVLLEKLRLFLDPLDL